MSQPSDGGEPVTSSEGLPAAEPSSSAGEPAVLVARHGHLGVLTLNRPKTLNALTLPMIQSMAAALIDWVDDDEVTTVLIEGAGRAFCAGGDIRAVYDSARTGSTDAAQLWREQYHLNATIARYPKPVVTFLDGITMGGGVGLGCHASHRIATENTLLAMPEVSIGLAPDVGGLLLLARAPGEVGTHLALTAGRIGAQDALYCGLVDHVLAADQLDALREALSAMPAADAIASVATSPQDLGPPLATEREWIDAAYTGDDVSDIANRLAQRTEPAAQGARAALAGVSPLAAVVCLRALRSAARLDEELAVFAQDYRVTLRFLDTHDLVAGIRSAIITKDRDPRWDPADLADVTPAQVARHFEGLGDRELFPAAP